MDRGDVYFSPDHEFSDGGHAKKLLILLNCPTKDKCYVFVKTTSNPKFKNNNPGCYSNDRGRGYFVIRENEDFFNIMTWVLFDPIILSQEEVDAESFEKRNLIFKTKLKDVTIRAIANCMKRSPFINGFISDMIS